MKIFEMMPIRIRMTPLTGYLITLSFFSGYMFLKSIQEQQQQLSLDNTDGEEETSNLRVRRHKRSLGSHTINNVDAFFNWLAYPETTCRKMLQLGGTYCKHSLDNEKVVCLDDDIALKPNSCTVYSFGVGYDNTFDDAADSYGCEVYMFDPTINENAVRKGLKKRQEFFHYGLDDHYHTEEIRIIYNRNDTEILKGTYDTYDRIQERIGHKDLQVHYLKIDIEGTEWKVLPYMMERDLLKGVMQLAIEIHTSDIIKLPQEKVISQLQEYANILTGLHKEGFLRAAYRPNVVLESLYHVPGQNRTIPTCGELFLVRRG